MTVERDDAVSVEEDVRMQAAAWGDTVAETVASLRGVVKTLYGAEALINAAVETENSLETMFNQLIEDLERAVRARPEADLKRTDYDNFVRKGTKISSLSARQRLFMMRIVSGQKQLPRVHVRI